MKKELKEIALNRLAVDWPIPDYTPLKVDTLAASLKSAGQLTPVLVFPALDGYQVLDGRRRVQALKQLGKDHVTAWIEDDIPTEKDAFLTALHLSFAPHPLSLMEQVELIERLTFHCDFSEAEIIRDYLPLLGLRAQTQTLKDFLGLTRLAPELRRMVAERGLGLKEARLLATFSNLEQEEFVRLLNWTHLTVSEIREAAALVEEISRREDLNPGAIIVHIALSEETPPARRGEALLTALKNRRYPVYQKLKADFDARRKRLKLPREIKLEPPPFFEGDKLAISFAFRNLTELRHYLTLLAQEKSMEDWEALLKLM